MPLRLPWLVARDTAALRHMGDLTDALGRSTRALAQLPGARGPEQDRIEKELRDLDAGASASLMAFLTSVRSSYVTPLPRQDLYLLAAGLHTAVQRVVGAGVLTHRAGLEELPPHALDILEAIGRQAELLRRALDQLRELDSLEDTWIQLLRGSRRADRIMGDWLADLGRDLLQRDFNRQREVAWALDSALQALMGVNTHLGVVLVRES